MCRKSDLLTAVHHSSVSIAKLKIQSAGRYVSKIKTKFSSLLMIFAILVIQKFSYMVEEKLFPFQVLNVMNIAKIVELRQVALFLNVSK